MKSFVVLAVLFLAAFAMAQKEPKGAEAPKDLKGSEAAYLAYPYGAYPYAAYPYSAYPYAAYPYAAPAAFPAPLFYRR